MAFLEDFLKISNWETLGFLLMITVAWIGIYFVGKKTKKNWSMKVISALMLGILLATVVGAMSNFEGRTGDDNHWTQQVFFYTGLFNNIFYKSVGFVIPFMLFASLTHTMSVIRRGKGAKVASKSFGMLFTMYFSGVLIALLLVIGFAQIDLSSIINTNQDATPSDIVPIAQTFINFLPGSIGGFFSSGIGVISAVIAGVVFGYTLNKLIKKNPDNKIYLTIERGVLGFYKMMMVIIRLIISYLPYAIVSFLTRAFIRYGLETLTTSGIFIGMMYGILAVQILYLSVVSSVLTKQSPLSLWRKASPPNQ